jgi:hypothetical protein
MSSTKCIYSVPITFYDGIRMDLREIGWGSVDWIQLAQDRDRWRDLVNTVMNLRVLATRS